MYGRQVLLGFIIYCNFCILMGTGTDSYATGPSLTNISSFPAKDRFFSIVCTCCSNLGRSIYLANEPSMFRVLNDTWIKYIGTYFEILRKINLPKFTGSNNSSQQARKQLHLKLKAQNLCRYYITLNFSSMQYNPFNCCYLDRPKTFRVG